MKNDRRAWLTVLLVLLMPLAMAGGAKAGSTSVSFGGEAPFRAGEVLVKLKPGAVGASERLAEPLFQGEPVGSENLRLVKVPAGQELTTIQELKRDWRVEYAEPNYIATAFFTPNDPHFPSQWGLIKIGAPTAWDTSTGSGILVAIVDTGVDLDHPDLVSQLDLAYAWNYIANNNNPDDDNGHGTHVAGIVAAATNNGIGVAGTAPSARLLPLKILDAGGSGTYSDMIAAISRAVQAGARVVNLSLGGTGQSTALWDAIQDAHNHGVIIVAAAGNKGDKENPVMYPAAYPYVIAVVATTGDDIRTGYSEYGYYIDLAAPGSAILSTYKDGAYAWLGGTSMAAPHVAGLAVLLWRAAPSLTPDEVEQRMKNTAVDLGSSGRDDYYGWGRIDAAATLATVLPSLQVSTTSLAFLAEKGNNPPPAILGVGNATNSPLTWTAQVSHPWLLVVPSSGSAPPSATAQVSINVSGLATGTYTATITINASPPETLNDPATITVTAKIVDKLFRVRFPAVMMNYAASLGIP